MKFLENRIPPPIVGGVSAIGMFGLAQLSAPSEASSTVKLIIIASFLIIGLALEVPAILAFRRHNTTVNPIHIDRANELVDSGAYRFSRNPMYLGMVCILTAWLIFLATPLAILGPICFVAYISKFQIGPEERFLKSKFGDRYLDYQSRVRRWI